MDLVFYLSGEHETLPRSEVLSLLKHRRMGGQIIEDLDQLLVCRVKGHDLDSFGLLGMTHAVLEHLGSSKAELEDILTLAAAAGRMRETFSVRVNRTKQYSKDISAFALERSIGEAICGEKVDLKNPKVPIRGFLTSGRFVMGKELLEIKRSGFDQRNPQFRPFFHPSSLSPILSRTLCNISGVMKGKKVLDPFCGTGGLLIEAGLLGAEVYGLDIDERMVWGCRRNLSHFGISGLVEQGDATKINYSRFFDVIITDPPYGRSSTTKGREVEALYIRATESIFCALKKGGTACIIAPNTIDLERIASKVGFTLDEVHSLRVHRSLTRKIVIVKK
ncbi:MAG: methyltransferase domain-containing protein [Candidatus Hydrothermarchaeales archaeon]